MSTPRDDDALSWAGDDDPTSVAGAPGAPESAAAAGRGSRRPDASREEDSVDGAAAHDPARARAVVAPVADGDPVVAPGGLSNAALISLGVLAGIYLLYTIGWLIGGLRVHTLSGLLGIASTVSVPVLVLAVAAPAIWFAAAYVLTRASRSWVRFAWLVAGALLLVPWPFATLGTGL